MKTIRLFHILACALTTSLAVSCSGSTDRHDDNPIPPATQNTAAAHSAGIKKGPRHNDRIRVNNIGHLREVFNDSNKYQYAHAERIGIEPISDLYFAYHTRRPLRHITTCDLYKVDSLTHSLPFLVPEAARLLEDIGRNFIDSLASRGADGYRIKVTSLLRTASSVRRLRRVNVNASDS